jgi:periplasmic divalent cation tolerance protein
MTKIVVVLTTMPDDARTDELARTLVHERLAACVSVSGPMTSTYRWKGAIEQDVERQVVIKTTADRLDALRRRLPDLHPYEVPEFLVLGVEQGSEAYLAWVTETTGS